MEATVSEIKNSKLEQEFKEFRENTIGTSCSFYTDYGKQELLYADWIASGRLYQPIEDIICSKVGPMMANTHSFSSESGKNTTYLYQEARKIIKTHVNANNEDILVTTGTGMTGALRKLQRIISLDKPLTSNAEEDRPVVFISHMEHHSNQVCWYETNAEVVILPPGKDNLIDPEILENELKKYENRKLKIGSFTACSNVTGLISPYYELAKIMHQHKGYCFVDFAASAPYVNMNMNPETEEEKLDAIFFSPHKFLGGPGACGVLIYNENLQKNAIPDNPGGGNVKWTNPWGKYAYSSDIEVREDGGTPGILQVMRAALAIRLKEKMNPKQMKLREEELLQLFYDKISTIPEINVLGNPENEQIGCVSFNVQDFHYNLIVRLLNDRFGIQVRGGWSCASTYAHYLFKIDKDYSTRISQGIAIKNMEDKPGWVRISLHPIMTNKEVLYIVDALKKIIENKNDWAKDYRYNPATNEFDRVEKSKVNLPDFNKILSL
ncbi:Selenocysteine lyase/Cysteine desulfurase [Salegentibacter holothuriorum]|uniref:Selenocysteine lyase/Cysteine desulfurase n=1 Tax=Salegentibacter holothuriorum TaxID=241145 RepID=A0A1T5DJL3_9FLAO|nr:aminotransferase class V-fold PLP-dependent enzyme [Salegentibacter holothuriorum]SKB71660.1 Selenocysteine lyase/Cysteine desulfurase [Salegentibacter holothuriorum]